MTSLTRHLFLGILFPPSPFHEIFVLFQIFFISCPIPITDSAMITEFLYAFFVVTDNSRISTITLLNKCFFADTAKSTQQIFAERAIHPKLIFPYPSLAVWALNFTVMIFFWEIRFFANQWCSLLKILP